MRKLKNSVSRQTVKQSLKEIMVLVNSIKNKFEIITLQVRDLSLITKRVLAVIYLLTKKGIITDDEIKEAEISLTEGSINRNTKDVKE